MIKTGSAREIIKNLKHVQREHVRNEVDSEFKKNSEMTDQDKMRLYLEKINQISGENLELNKKLLSHHVAKSGAVKAATIAGVGAAAVFSPLQNWLSNL